MRTVYNIYLKKILKMKRKQDIIKNNQADSQKNQTTSRVKNIKIEIKSSVIELNSR